MTRRNCLRWGGSGDGDEGKNISFSQKTKSPNLYRFEDLVFCENTNPRN